MSRILALIAPVLLFVAAQAHAATITQTSIVTDTELRGCSRSGCGGPVPTAIVGGFDRFDISLGQLNAVTLEVNFSATMTAILPSFILPSDPDTAEVGVNTFLSTTNIGHDAYFSGLSSFLITASETASAPAVPGARVGPITVEASRVATVADAAAISAFSAPGSQTPTGGVGDVFFALVSNVTTGCNLTFCMFGGVGLDDASVDLSLTLRYDYTPTVIPLPPAGGLLLGSGLLLIGLRRFRRGTAEHQ